jgi:hypothetical protein
MICASGGCDANGLRQTGLLCGWMIAPGTAGLEKDALGRAAARTDADLHLCKVLLCL